MDLAAHTRRDGITMIFLGSNHIDMKISAKSDFSKLTKFLTAIQKKQLPYVTKNVLNDVAFSARETVMDQSKVKLDRPKPLFFKSVRVAKATKQDLATKVGFVGEIGQSQWA